VPLLVIPQGLSARIAHVPPISIPRSHGHVSKHSEPSPAAKEVTNIMRSRLQPAAAGRGAPVIIELPNDAYARTCPSRSTTSRVVGHK